MGCMHWRGPGRAHHRGEHVSRAHRARAYRFSAVPHGVGRGTQGLEASDAKGLGGSDGAEAAPKDRWRQTHVTRARVTRAASDESRE